MQHTKGRASDLTHYGAILRELVMHGHVTFAELQERYPMMQYEGFLQATKRARRDGIITGPGNSTTVDHVSSPDRSQLCTRRYGATGEYPKNTISPVTGSVLGCAVMDPASRPSKSNGPIVVRSSATSIGPRPSIKASR